MSNKKNNFILQGGILAIASILSRLIGLVYKIIMTRQIGSVGMGLYNAAYEYYNLALILSSLSIPLAISKLVAAREQNKEYKNSYHIFNVAVLLASVMGAIAGLLLYFFADELTATSDYPSAAYPLRVLAPTLFVVAIMGVFRGLFQGKKTMIPTAMSQIIEQLVNAVVSVVAAIWLMKIHNSSAIREAYGAMGGTLGTLVGAMAGLLFLLGVFFLNRPLFIKQAKRDYDPVPESFGFASFALLITVFPIILSQTVYQISGLIDVTIFGNVMSSFGLDEAARSSLFESYSNKYRQLTNVPIAVAAALSSSIVPSLSASLAKQDYKTMRHKVASSIKINMLIAIPSAVGMSVLGRQIVELLYKDTTKLDGALMQIGSVAIIFFAYSTITNGILQGINHVKAPVIHAGLSLAIHVVFLYAMLRILKLNAYGLVIGNVSFAMVISILNWLSIKQYLNYKQELTKTFLKPMVASLGMGAVAFLIYQGLYKLSGSNLLGILIAVPIAIITYFILVLLLHAADENEIMVFPKGAAIVRLCKKMHLLS